MMVKAPEGTQLKPEYIMVDNEQHEDFYEDTMLKQQLSSMPQRSRASIWTTRKTFYTILMLLVIVGSIVTVSTVHYTQHEKDGNNSNEKIWTDGNDRLPQLRSGSIYVSISLTLTYEFSHRLVAIQKTRRVSKDLGHIYMYIHKLSPVGVRLQSRKLRFPIARYDRQNFPLDGPFLSLGVQIPIFVEPRTRQTIISGTQGWLYIMPAMINRYNELYSIGELLKYGYVSFTSGTDRSLAHLNMLSHFQPTPLHGQRIPRISSRTGGFTSGFRTNYERFNIPQRQERPLGDYAPYPSEESSAEQREAEEDEEENENEAGEGEDDDKEYPYTIPAHPVQQSKEPSITTTTHGVSTSTTSSRSTTPITTSSTTTFVNTTSIVCGRYFLDQSNIQIVTTIVPEVEVVDNEEGEIDGNDTVTFENCRCQQQILIPSIPYEHGLFIILHISNEDEDSVWKACQKLPQLKNTLLSLHRDATINTTLGFGYERTQIWLAQANISFPRAFMEYREKRGPTGRYMPSTGGDVFLDIRSNRKDLCYELGRQFMQLIPLKSIIKVDDTFGFAYMSSKLSKLSKDFIGFEDGNDNPEGITARAAAALIAVQNDEDVHVGGSFGLTQKWIHNLTKFNEMTQQQKVDVIGRTMGDFSLEIEPKLPSSHVGRTHLLGPNGEIQIVRKSLPHGDLITNGLYFVAFASNPIKFESLLHSMLGNVNCISDRLMEFTSPITGNYWYIPSQICLNKLFLL
ncbi:unnamed protein product [Adineta ricciae]|uniref:Dyp-type peroxidase C-terminal domain-containing protein n=1 Tax=Adineta ricciae TaxID=249248 RepID=A0A815VVR2_ADIRI|nr:unnamed protein product [Adineta ricciae]